ncbi:MAG: hypothetical protein JOZ96_20985 [Acidobacteria bacterium]|nr:hypothetical protein [Acidobacteriota bacterium]
MENSALAHQAIAFALRVNGVNQTARSQIIGGVVVGILTPHFEQTFCLAASGNIGSIILSDGTKHRRAPTPASASLERQPGP